MQGTVLPTEYTSYIRMYTYEMIYGWLHMSVSFPFTKTGDSSV